MPNQTESPKEKKERLKGETEGLIKKHGCNPAVEYEPKDDSPQVVYRVQLPEGERASYKKDSHFDSDKRYVKKRGQEEGLIAKLECEWDKFPG